MVLRFNPGGCEILPTHPDWLRAPPSLLYNRYWVIFPGLRWPGCGIDHPPPCSTKVKERVELYLYYSSEPSWPVLTVCGCCVCHVTAGLYYMWMFDKLFRVCLVYELYGVWNVVLLQSVRENFIVNFLGLRFQVQQTSVSLLLKSSLLGHCSTRNLLKNALCLPEKN